MGIKEQIIFPEISYDKVDQVRGLDIVICTTAKNGCRGAGAVEGDRYAVRQLTGAGER